MQDIVHLNTLADGINASMKSVAPQPVDFDGTEAQLVAALSVMVDEHSTRHNGDGTINVDGNVANSAFQLCVTLC